MRILLTAHRFLPDHTAGTEVLTFQVAKELERQGHEVRIVTSYPLKQTSECAARFDHYVYQGLEVDRYFHPVGATVGAQSNIVELEYENHFVADWLQQFLNKWRPDIVHFFHLQNLSASAIDICRDINVPMVFTPTDFWLVCPTVQLLLPDGSLCNGPDRQGVNCLRHAIADTQSTAIKRLFSFMPDSLVASAIRVAHAPALAAHPRLSWASALARRAESLRQRVSWLDCVIAPTRLMETVLIHNGMRPKRLVFSRFGIDQTGFDLGSVRRESANTLRVGFIGSLSHPKGAHILLEAVRRIAPETPVEVQVFGNPNVYPAYAKKLVDIANGDARIQFCGTFPNETIGKVLAELDVLVVPSLWYENTPLVIYSAQAAGCPIVASDLGGMSEVIRDGVDGMLFPRGGTEALASILETLSMDKELLRTLAGNSPQPKSTATYTAELVSIYQEILAVRETTS